MSHISETHEVFNQPPPLEGANFWQRDPALREWTGHFGAAWAEPLLHEYGALAGGPLFEAGFAANDNPPRFRSHDRYGHRIDQVDFHPAYHQLMRVGVARGLPALPWRAPREGAHVARAAMMYLHNQADAGTCCPLTMTFASVAALQRQPELAASWLPKIYSAEYDPRNVPVGAKSGATIGMAMTEKQGGSDVHANTTLARPLGSRGPGQAYELVGHKWFCSAPMSDAFLTLAQCPGGLSCFLLPRFRPDGQHNALRIQRLKAKLGNHSNASAEIEYHGALAWMLGEEGRGVRTILEMVALTRFDCITGSASLMRQALTQAVHHCRYRQVSGKPLVEQPLMQNVLADLALESEAALALSLRLAHALDVPGDPRQRAFIRLLTAAGKYWVCKRAPAMIHEAAECLGGAGYVEESILPRLYREAPVNSVWEGSGNVQCLDVLRALNKERDTAEALLVELDGGAGDSRLQRHVSQLQAELADPDDAPWRARQLAEDIALAVQARLLMDGASSAVAESFLASRLSGSGRAFGTLPRGIPAAELLVRALGPDGTLTDTQAAPNAGKIEPN